jgi:chloramphenicol 3-O phosphotransferase
VAGIIFLHGASSSGKSTLARALQARIDQPFWHYSIDHLRDSGVLPMARFKGGDFAWAESRAAFFDGFHHSVAAFADAGNNIILEHILEAPGWIDVLRRLLAPHRVLFVGLHTSLSALKQREQLRGDRPVGSAEADFQAIHKGLSYDLEIDAERDPESNAELVRIAWATHFVPSKFFALSTPAPASAE